jgi:hypothetical protein
MGMIEDIGTYLTATTGNGTLGTDVFLNVMPETTRLVTAIVETRGGPPAFSLGGTVPVHTEQAIEIVVRSTAGTGGYANPTNARTRIQRAYLRLNGIANAALSGSTYLRVQANQDPYLAERDEQGRVVFRCGFSVMKRGSTAI